MRSVKRRGKHEMVDEIIISNQRGGDDIIRFIGVMSIIILVLTSCSEVDSNISDCETKLTLAQESVKALESEKIRLNDEVKKLKESNAYLKELNEELLASINKHPEYYGGLLYYAIGESEYVRFLSKRVELLALPYEGAPKIGIIEDNTLVTVYDKVSVQNDIEKGAFWYYVSIPVYDTPMDYKGWIRAIDTIDYNEETRDILQSDVYIRKGSRVIESFNFPNIEDDVGYIVDYELRGRLEDRKNGYVRLDCPGGMSCWVKEEDIIYPKLP